MEAKSWDYSVVRSAKKNTVRDRTKKNACTLSSSHLGSSNTDPWISSSRRMSQPPSDAAEHPTNGNHPEELGQRMLDRYETSSPMISAYNRGWMHVKQFIDQGVDANAAAGNGNTLLHVLSSRSEVQYIKYMLENGANPNAYNRDGKTPLHMAKTVEAIEALVAGGADVHARQGLPLIQITNISAIRDHLAQYENADPRMVKCARP